MNLKEQIQLAIKESIKVKNSPRTSALRLLFNEFQIEDKKTGQKRTYEEVTLAWKKKLNKSMKSFSDGEVKDNLIREANIIEEFCPKQMSKEEIISTIQELIDTGKVETVDMKAMKLIMPVLKGKADGKEVKEVIETWN